MEKGSFHTSVSTGTPAKTDDAVKNIPLPNQLPKGMDFSEVPQPTLKSSTLESVISQNEDLMARLSMSLRKTNQLEERCAVLEKDNNSYGAKFETLREQVLLLKEKDSISSSRHRELAEEATVSQSQLKRLEKIYAEL